MKSRVVPFTIREATADDIPVLAGLIRDAFRTVADRFGLTPENCPKHPSNCSDAWIAAALEQGVTYYVLNVDDHACGCAALELARPGVCYLERLAVLPQFRNRGHGGALAIHVLEQAQALGADRVEIGIIAEDTDLANWYQELGFRQTRTAEFDHLPFTVALMKRALAPNPARLVEVAS